MHLIVNFALLLAIQHNDLFRHSNHGEYPNGDPVWPLENGGQPHHKTNGN